VNKTEDDTVDSNETSQISEHGLLRAMHALRDPRYRWWFGCQIFSSSGSMTQAVAQAWLVLQLTGSALDLGIFGAVSWAPVLLGGAWAGVLVDRMDRRRLLIATQAIFVVLCAAQTALVATGQIRLWMILVFGVINGTTMAVDLPGRQVYVFSLVGRDRATSAIGLYEVIVNASRVIGPAAGGVLLVTAGVAPCFGFNALSYLPTLWVLARFTPNAGAAPGPARRPPARIRDGLLAVRRNPQIRSCILIAFAGGMLFNLSVATPLFVSRVLHLGGGGYGAMMASFGLGAVPGALMAASSKREPSGSRIRVLALLTGAAIVATALTPVVAGAFIGIAIAGFLSIWLVAAANTLVQLRSSPQLRGRIMGIWTMALPGGYPVTALIVALVAGVNARAGFALAGITMIAITAATWTSLGRPASTIPPRAIALAASRPVLDR
jgi:predicted MFS family arabinose efflux permease